LHKTIDNGEEASNFNPDFEHSQRKHKSLKSITNDLAAMEQLERQQKVSKEARFRANLKNIVS